MSLRKAQKNGKLKYELLVKTAGKNQEKPTDGD